MADKWDSEQDAPITGTADEEIRGVSDDEDEFDSAEDLEDEEDEEEEGSTL